MKSEIIQMVGGKPATTSLIIAKKFEREHFNVLRDIEKLECSQAFRELNFEASSYKSKQGKKLPMFIVTRDGFSMLAMGFTGSKAMKWKEAYILAFNAMEDEILKKAVSDKIEWSGARSQSIVSRNDLTDTIQEFVEYAKAQGSKNAAMYYANITKMEYKALGILSQIDGERSNLRDKLNVMQLVHIATAEFQAQAAIKRGMEMGMNYKDIYTLAKRHVERFADSIHIPMIGEPKRIKHPE